MDLGEQKTEFSVAKIFLVAFGILGLFLNAIEMRLLIHKGKKKSCYEILLLGLGCADILAASIFSMHGILMMLITEFLEHLSDEVRGKLQKLVVITRGAIAVSMALSFTNVWLITIDRYIAVNFPLKHRIWVTKRRTRIMLVVIWCLQTTPLCLSLFVPTIKHRPEIIKVLGGLNMLGCVALLFVYCCIARKLRKAQRERKRWNTQQEDGSTNSNFKQEGLVMVNSIAVTLCFIICYAPTWFFTLFSEPTGFNSRYYARQSFLALNPVIDPMIYFLFSCYLKKDKVKNILSAQQGGGLRQETVGAK